MASETTSEQTERLSDDELAQLWLTRARGVLMGKYASDEVVWIYGLTVQRAGATNRYWDVFYKEGDDEDEDPYRHIDTLDAEKFASARQVLQQLESYFPDEEPPEEPQSETADPEPSPTFQ